MNAIDCYGVTRRALQLLHPLEAPNSSIPTDWFNWSNPNLGGRAIDRLTYLDPDLNASHVTDWDQAAKQAGYGRVLIFSTEDPVSQAGLSVNLSSDVVIQPIAKSPSIDELEAYRDLLALIREPEAFFQDYWRLIDLNGVDSIARFGLEKVPVAHWLAYGQGLKTWINKTATGQPGSVHRVNCPDYAVWNGMKTLDAYYPDPKLDLHTCWELTQDHWKWSLSNPCTLTDIPAMKLDGFVAYYPVRKMPCCGLAVKENGELVPIGALTNDWAWATEETVAIFEKIRKERQVLALPKKPPYLFFEASTNGFRLLASYVYTPQPLGAADGRFIPVEVLEYKMRVELWIDTNENEEKTAFVVTPYWQETPEKLLRIEVIFDGEPATMEVNGLTSTLLNLQGQDQIEGVFLTTPSLHIEVRIYAAD